MPQAPPLALPYPREVLLARGAPRVYAAKELTHLAWPLGELGASWVSLSGQGELVASDAGGPPLPRLVLAVARPSGEPMLRLLQGNAVAGLPAPCPGVSFEAAFPFARLRLENPLWPQSTVLEAHSPFIPGDLAESSLPAAQLNLHLRQPGRALQRAALLICLAPGAPGRVTAWREGELQGLRWQATATPAAGPAAWELATPWPATHGPGSSPAAGSGHGALVTALQAVAAAHGGDYLILLADMPSRQALNLPLWLSWPALGHWPATPATASPRATLHYLAAHHDRLTLESRLFSEALHSSSLPAPVLEAVAGQLLTLGQAAGGGGALAFSWFFPELARAWSATPPPADADMNTLAGTLLALYRDWLFGGDDRWVRGPWGQLSTRLTQLIAAHDPDGDGYPELLATDGAAVTRFLAALRAAEELARHLGDERVADAWRTTFGQVQAMQDALRFNGDYYQTESCEQPDEPSGACRADQLDGQLEARLLHLGALLDPENLETAANTLFERNWQAKLTASRGGRGSPIPKGEAGLAVSSRGSKRAAPVGCGEEYRLASLLIYENHLAEGLALVKGARDRYSGVWRNPWPERESQGAPREGQHAWALLLALSDLSYSASAQALHLSPRLYTEDFTCLLVVPGAWGLLRQKALPELRRELRVEVRRGELRLSTLSFGFPATQVKVTLGEQVLPHELEGFGASSIIRLHQPVLLKAGQTLLLSANLPEDLEGPDPDADPTLLP